MHYGLYLSATGVLANTYRQDVISNNLANSETVGFKRDLALFQERRTEAQQRGLGKSRTNANEETLGGGLLASPTYVDFKEGEFETTHNDSDAAIVGPGYFGVQDGDKTLLTRDGRFMVDKNGFVVLATAKGQKALDPDFHPIQVESTAKISIGASGEIVQNGKAVARLGAFNVANAQSLRKVGGNMFSAGDKSAIRPTEAVVRSGMIERSNVDSATELSQLMETQRQLEANANMIRYQDQMLSRLVTDVGKIG